MASLHIYNDSPAFSDRATSDREMPAPLTRIGCKTRDEFISTIGTLWGKADSFQRIVFDTHGSAGAIYFGNQPIDGDWWERASQVAPVALGASGGKAYFSGCNVAEGEAGWSFLVSAARCLFKGVAGQTVGWTSSGFANPVNGHTVHLWGDARTVFMAADGTVTERFSQ